MKHEESAEVPEPNASSDQEFAVVGAKEVSLVAATEGSSETVSPNAVSPDAVSPDAVSPVAAGAETALSDLDRAILDFEGLVWKKTALKERAISTNLGISPIQYYQRLVALTRIQQAYEYAPAVIRKLRDAYTQRTSRKLV